MQCYSIFYLSLSNYFMCQIITAHMWLKCDFAIRVCTVKQLGTIKIHVEYCKTWSQLLCMWTFMTPLPCMCICNSTIIRAAYVHLRSVSSVQSLCSCRIRSITNCFLLYLCNVLHCSVLKINPVEKHKSSNQSVKI